MGAICAARPLFYRHFGKPRPSVMFRAGGIDIILCSIANQTEERGQFKLFGIEGKAQRVVVCTVNVSRIPYCNVRRPIWPLDDFSD
ncbi:hypothetical protein [Hyphomicrobium sp. CS1BSMeth3]|uniref:hypothetical protein n=1 Tax=Hyphomicrobium sp. CS1BSMeth3 TaxID=1892844 RepID=UPI0011607F2C|nr:hypothetical protein [Hyphomicrobium sp. CS1BSMeth3]